MDSDGLGTRFDLRNFVDGGLELSEMFSEWKEDMNGLGDGFW